MSLRCALSLLPTVAVVSVISVLIAGCATRGMNKEEYFKYLEDREDARAEAAEQHRKQEEQWRREDAAQALEERRGEPAAIELDPPDRGAA